MMVRMLLGFVVVVVGDGGDGGMVLQMNIIC